MKPARCRKIAISAMKQSGRSRLPEIAAPLTFHALLNASPICFLSLVLEGGGDLLTQVSRDDIVAYLDFRRIRNNPGQEHPAVILTPPGVHYRDAKPKTFRLVFEGNSSN